MKNKLIIVSIIFSFHAFAIKQNVLDAQYSYQNIKNQYDKAKISSDSAKSSLMQAKKNLEVAQKELKQKQNNFNINQRELKKLNIILIDAENKVNQAWN